MIILKQINDEKYYDLQCYFKNGYNDIGCSFDYNCGYDDGACGCDD
jgi:hypothetical protein